MFVSTIKKRLLFLGIFFTIFIFILFFIFKDIFYSNNILIDFAIHPFNICEKYPDLWNFIKITYVLFYCAVILIISNFIYSFIFCKKENLINENEATGICNASNNSKLNLLVGKNEKGDMLYIDENGLYQNILITGTIGSGKTSSAMYPFTRQLIEYKADNKKEKLGLLILDVKGNYYKQVEEYCEIYNRKNDLMVLSLDGSVCYNPLDKPNLKAHILANRLKTILTLFSSNNGEQYWLDKSEQILTECIKLCRLYNNGYVTFDELHKLITIPDYYSSKITILRNKFLAGKLSKEDCFNLLTSIEFFEKEFLKLDSRTMAILKSEITRITGCFVSDYQVQKIFCPSKENINFRGFKNLISQGKILVLNMNLAEFKNLSKIIAAYLKLDFQTEVMSRLSNNKNKFLRSVAFISDEFHEYVTSTDADFFAQSREAKCINIVATQSYTSLLNTLDSQNTTKAIIQNLINKLWFRTDDIFTIEDAQKQLGKEEKTKYSKTISENAKTTSFNVLTKKFNSLDSNLSESINSYSQFDYAFDTNFFTQKLETFSCLAFLSTGNSIIPPQKIKTIPYFKNIKEVL